MSAPRKITTARRIGSGRRDILTAETTMSMGYVGAVYHHDDVVRELVVTLERAEMMMRMRGYLEMANECAAALTKIAQEG